MKAKIVNFRGGKRTQKTNQMALIVEKCSTKEAASKLLGKKVAWKTQSGKKIVGTITRVHGNKGAVIARFNKGLPGQAIGTEVDIKD